MRKEGSRRSEWANDEQHAGEDSSAGRRNVHWNRDFTRIGSYRSNVSGSHRLKSTKWRADMDIEIKLTGGNE